MAMDPRDAFIFDPVGSHQEDNTISTATTITPAAGAGKVMIQALAQNVRYTLDGTAPTASKGFQLEAGQMIVIPVGKNTIIKVIEETATADIEWQSAL